MITVDTNKLSTAVRVARKNMTLREYSSITGISVSTLSRVENGHIPDTESYLTLINEVGIPSAYFEKRKSQEDR